MKRLRLLGGTVIVISMFWLLGILFSSPTAEAATLNVVTGADAIDNLNDQCQLSEAIQNINDQFQTNDDCLAGDGNNDTIYLPVGTVTLSGDLPTIEQSVIVQGQGIGETVVDGDGQYTVFGSEGDSITDISIYDLTISNYNEAAIGLSNSNVVLSGLEITGITGVLSQQYGIILLNKTNGLSLNADISDVRIHDLEIDANSIAHIIAISNSASNSGYNVSIENVTIANINNASGSINTVILGNGFFGNSTGYFESTIRNLTINNISGAGSVNGVAGGSIMIEGTGESVAVYDIANTTITGISSQSSMYGSGSSLALSTAAVNAAASATATLQIRNSLFANNLALGAPAGCQAVDVGVFFGDSQGESLTSIISDGGNISDDNACIDFTDPTDQNNVDPADLMLGTLGDYGGPIPTIPLLPGSIAIDSGTTVAGLTTDARLFANKLFRI